MRPTARGACRLLVTCLLAGVATIGLLLGFRALPTADRDSYVHAELKGFPVPSLRTPGLRSEIRAATVESPALRRLTFDGQSTPLGWMPDGQTILVRRPGQMVGQQQLTELWALSLRNESAWRISDNASYPAAQGTQVTYLRHTARGGWETIVTDLSDGRTTSLGPGQWNLPPTWVESSVFYLHPSGERIVKASLSGMQQAWLSLGASLHQQRARLSRDGRSIASTGGRQLIVMDEEGQTVVADADQIWGFAWSPVQNRLAYVRSVGGPHPELWVWDGSTRESWPLIVLPDQDPMALGHLGAPAWSADGRTVALARHPSGSGLMAGDIWLVSADGSDLHSLALTAADEHSPCWAPSGRSLAFSLDGDVWIADLEAPGLETALVAAGTASVESQYSERLLEQAADPGPAVGIAPTSLTPPATIRVMHDSMNTCRARPEGYVDIYDFEEYVKRVVPHEVYVSWPAETLKAQAIAARTYAWRKVLDRVTWTFDVVDSTADQYMCDTTYASTNAAVDETRGQYLSYRSNVLYAFYCAETGSPTNYRQQLDLSAAPYLRPVNDPVGLGQVRRGHSWGMSQWGAYRWAARHGWDYQQILCHYYTGALIERSNAFAQPLAGLTLPWPDFYVNTNAAYLQANAADDGIPGYTGVSTVTFSSRVTETWTALYTDTNAADGWAYVWPVSTYADTFTPSLDLQIVVRDGLGQMAMSGVSHIGLHRTPPTGTLGVSSTAVTTLALSLRLTVSDALPVSGTARVSLGTEDWAWEDSALYRTAGEIVTDNSAVDGSAWHIGAGNPGVLYGPYTSKIPAGRHYRAYFRLKVPATALTSPAELLKLDIARYDGDELLGIRYLRGTDFVAGDTYQEFALDFDYPETGGELEFRTDSYGAFDLWVDRVSIAHYPVAVSPWLSWTLPAREGSVALKAWLIDGAENIAEMNPLTVTVTDRSPPGGWRGFRCDGQACTVQVRDSIAGLDVGSTAYRYLAVDETSWTDWLSTTCTGVSGTHDWQTIAVVSTSYPATPVSRIQFRASDVAATPNQGLSPEYVIRRIYLPLAISHR